MCTIALLVEVVPDSRLVIAANRDELYARATRKPERLQRFERGDAMVGGVDEVSGGTWLAVTRGGRFAAVTNQRALAPLPPTSVRSRGLVVGELAGAPDMHAYVLALDPTQYASMNLAWADAGGAPCVAYLRHDGERTIEELPRGIHVLCNDKLGSPGFPRGERLAAALAALASGGDWATIRDRLPALLADHALVPDAEVPPSHLPLEVARELTACCIHTSHYGTRSATIAALDADRVNDYRYTDGRPCTTPFIDGRGLFE